MSVFVKQNDANSFDSLRFHLGLPSIDPPLPTQLQHLSRILLQSFAYCSSGVDIKAAMF
jgi:hypothetical protein